ncbi:SDR family oxidoreductase [Pelagibius litoralis]|uniref:SDR family oxidoreductase n=1 Tax=Pelagibius litoralis TaxID=374515 RepID=A0A967C1M8_9PROT|nr:SDR family oxidoreductase [Pelagibius litoralis]NIA67486.1 SDR family oxidoreductase [Pelagibius litoralis]
MTATATYPSLKDRVVFVSGGGSGIGASIVEHFCRQGARVGFVDVDAQGSETLVADMAAAGHHKPHFVNCDLRDIGALRSAIAEVRAIFGPITVLINNAANDQRHDIDEVTPEFWDDRFAVNLKHQFFAAQAIYPDMEAGGGGTIVNVGSVSWMIGQGGMPCYTTAKSAVAGLTRALARDLGPKNIRVNCVVPGWIMTQRQIDLWLTPEAEADLMKSQCLKRKLYPEDIAKAVLFFASEDSGAFTNQSYVADGGWV